MSYACTILADSASPFGSRLTTFEVTFPRMVLADMTRHRMLSYSFESTRAVPVEKRIEMARSKPFVPIFRERVAGMAMGKPLVGAEQRRAQWKWIDGAHKAADLAESLLHVEKGLAGRVLEPYSWITGIVSGTEWENFFNLRCHPAAQYELQVIAKMMRQAREESTPASLAYGEWHLPLWNDSDVTSCWPNVCDETLPAKVSAGRCAAVSYLRHHDGQPLASAYDRWEQKLAPSAHWSPGEHPAQACKGRWGNFIGFIQLRKFYDGESVAEDPA